MNKDQYFILRGYTQLNETERQEVLNEIQEFENSQLDTKQLKYFLWHISTVGLDLETKSNGPMATSTTANICPCCRR
jgi:hypothetical protein